MKKRRIPCYCGDRGSPKKLRKRIPEIPVIKLLNGDVSSIGLSPLVISGLKASGFDCLADFKKALEKGRRPSDYLGLKSRLEIHRLLKRNGIKLPSNWFWR